MNIFSFHAPAEGLDYGRKHLFPSLEWTMHRGETWGVVGPNGCGKSVLVQLLSGALFHMDADIAYGFVDPDGRDPERAIAVVSLERQAAQLAAWEAYVQMRWNSTEEESTPTLDTWLSQDAVEERAAYEISERSPASVRAFNAKRTKTLAALDLTRLLDRRLAALSNGEMRRSLLARALLSKPRVVVFDAPYVGLDTSSRAVLARTIADLAEASKKKPSAPSVIVATVRAEELPPSVTHVLVLDANGAVVYIGPRAKAPREIAMARDVNANGEMTSRAAGKTKREPARFRISGTNEGNAKVLVDMRDLHVAYGDNVVFDGLNWRVREGERWLVKGPNGSGKTTLLAFLIGDHPQAYANHVVLFGRRRGTGESIWSIKKRIGWVSPELHACTDRTLPVLDIVLSGFCDTPFFTETRTPAKIRKARAWLKRLDMEEREDTVFGSLSSGEQRLVLLARALVKEPAMLVLDEPCQNLDAKNRERFVALVDKLCAATPRLTLVYVTHMADTEPKAITHRLIAEV